MFAKTPNGQTLNHGAHLALGSFQGFIGSAVSLPTGLITAALLTRWLGPEKYGLFTVAATIVGLIEISITTGFSRSAEKLVTEADNWRPVATRFVQAQLVASIITAALLVAVAPILATLLNSPALSFFLRVYAIGIPVTALGNIHQSILIGRDRFGQRALLLGAYWIIRLFFMILLVYRFPTVTAAIAANIIAAAFTLVWARVYISPSILGKSDFPVQKLWVYAWPLFFFIVGLSLFRQMDLLFVKALCAQSQVAGFYGATKNLTIIPSLVAASLAPLLLAKLSKMLQLGQVEAARVMAQTTMRLILCLLPFAGLAAGAAPEIVTVIYGHAFRDAAPLLAVLIFGAIGIAMISVTASIFIAAGYPRLPFFLTGALLPVAIVCHTFLIPRYGAIGAATATTCLAWSGAGAAILGVFRVWKIRPSAVTFLRSILGVLLAYGLATLWVTPGLMVILKLVVLCLIILTAFVLAGELSDSETTMIRFAFLGRFRQDNPNGAPVDEKKDESAEDA